MLNLSKLASSILLCASLVIPNLCMAQDRGIEYFRNNISRGILVKKHKDSYGVSRQFDLDGDSLPDMATICFHGFRFPTLYWFDFNKNNFPDSGEIFIDLESDGLNGNEEPYFSEEDFEDLRTPRSPARPFNPYERTGYC